MHPLPHGPSMAQVTGLSSLRSVHSANKAERLWVAMCVCLQSALSLSSGLSGLSELQAPSLRHSLSSILGQGTAEGLLKPRVQTEAIYARPGPKGAQPSQPLSFVVRVGPGPSAPSAGGLQSSSHPEDGGWHRRRKAFCPPPCLLEAPSPIAPSSPWPCIQSRWSPGEKCGLWVGRNPS